VCVCACVSVCVCVCVCASLRLWQRLLRFKQWLEGNVCVVCALCVLEYCTFYNTVYS